MNTKPNFRTLALNFLADHNAGNITPKKLAQMHAADIQAALIQENEYIDFERINSDAYGNPRYVCHYSALLKDTDTDRSYNLAIRRAHKIGGRKYSNKSYGGGIVFQSYNIEDTAESIKALLKEI